MTPTNPSLQLGDYVETRPHGHRGRIKSFNHRVDLDPRWIEGVTSLSDEDKAADRWVSILCHKAGSVCIPEQLVDKVEPFDFTNHYAAMHGWAA